MPYVKSLRDTLVSTLNGHTIRVAANKPKYIPPEVLAYALSVGCAECKENGQLIVDAALASNQLPVDEVPQLTLEQREDTTLRESALIQAIAKLFNDNDPKTFTADNLPKVRAVEALVGFPTSGPEVSAALEKYITSR